MTDLVDEPYDKAEAEMEEGRDNGQDQKVLDVDQFANRGPQRDGEAEEPFPADFLRFSWFVMILGNMEGDSKRVGVEEGSEESSHDAGDHDYRKESSQVQAAPEFQKADQADDRHGQSVAQVPHH